MNHVNFIEIFYLLLFMKNRFKENVILPAGKFLSCWVLRMCNNTFVSLPYPALFIYFESKRNNNSISWRSLKRKKL